MLTFFEVHFSAIAALFVMWIWHYMAGGIVRLRNKASRQERINYAIFVTIERWLGYFVIFVGVYINSM